MNCFSFFAILLSLVSWAAPVAAQYRRFLLNFEGNQFDSGRITGRIQDPIDDFVLSDFSVITAQDLPSDKISITSLKTSLLRPCSPNHYIVRIAPGTQDATTDRGSTVGIRSSLDANGNPSFRSFDIDSLCMACVFLPAITQGQAVGGPIPTDPLTQVAAPASCNITLTGQKYTPPGQISTGPVQFTVPYYANAPYDVSDPMSFRVSGMTRYLFGPRWTDLVLLQIKISDAMIPPAVGLPPGLNPVFKLGNNFASIALDNFNGTKHLGSGSVGVP
ncbi:hypothetical protein H072_295 [Dactylellina haptotyla CBS 200.50]|uniref:Uncharacterized protein n=1 Tax=Dactylellina haptotyla (strain CBS 200.50) TaxID=1284197 RepID=S8AS27_DACHA|nr:hypothetical protein H072_295 [Dactylellina haptotyla CBS 200.50]